jgi:protein-S-isoprenylcysteine O-methyltransferase Ste14
LGCHDTIKLLMYLFLAPLLLGFASNAASAFTTAFSRWWGDQRGTLVTFILRNILGIPMWTIGFLLAAHAPSTTWFTSTIVSDVFGWLIIAPGVMIILVALTTIRWRAAKPTKQDTLVNHGIYSYVRHPIHTGTLLEFAGLVLLIPTQTILLACIIGIIWVIVQTRLEEIDLLQRLPKYGEYMKEVPCFVPRFRIR